MTHLSNEQGHTLYDNSVMSRGIPSMTHLTNEQGHALYNATQ